MSDLESDFRKLAADARQMAEENAKLRKVKDRSVMGPVVTPFNGVH
jgi:hypothetical protein